MNSDERFPQYPIPGSGVSARAIFISFREILFYSLILSASTTLAISLANDYLALGLWYLVFLSIKKYFIFFLFVLAALYLLFFLIGKVFSPALSGRLKQLIILATCIYLAYVVLEYSGLLLSSLESTRVRELTHYTGSILTGVLLFSLFKFCLRRRTILTQFGFYSFIPAFIIGVFFVTSPSLVKTSHESRNVVLITVDTLRADHLGCYDYERNTSPNIDDFANGAIIYENPIVQWPKTSPSVSSMITSLYCGQTGINSTRHKLPWIKTTIAEILINKGYLTAGDVGNVNMAKGDKLDQDNTYNL